jgi:hypothetical protein
MELLFTSIVVDVEQTENTDGNLVIEITAGNNGVGIEAAMIIFDLAKEDLENAFQMHHHFLVQAGLSMTQIIILPCYTGMHWSWSVNVLSGANINIVVDKSVTLHMPYTN